MKKKIKGITSEALTSLLNKMLNEHIAKLTPTNKVSVADVEVESSVESLDTCKKAVNDLIKVNKKFITLRQNKLKADNFGYFG